MASQPEWRWCNKCQGLFFFGHPTQGVCPSSGAHDAGQSGHYAVLFGDGLPGAQEGWRFCKKCEGLFFGGNPDQGPCPAGGKHDSTDSGHYSVHFGDNVPGTQRGWRFCKKCEGLFFGGNPDQGPCPAGGKHDSTDSGHYGVLWEPTYLFSLDCFRIQNTRARHEDSDLISLVILDTKRIPIAPAVTKDMGNVNNGDFSVGLVLGPLEVSQSAAFSLSIANSGYDRSNNHAAEIATNAAVDTVLAAAAAVIGAVAGGVLIPGIVSAAGALVGAVGHVIDGLVFTNCDGQVALAGIGINPNILSGWAAGGPHRETQHNTFESQQGCGGNSEYDVTWSVVQADPGWIGWNNAGEGYTTVSVAATSYRNQLFVFAIGTAAGHLSTDERIHFAVSPDGQNWPAPGWHSEIPGNARTTLPVSATTFQDRLVVFHSGMNRRIYATAFDGQIWNEWTEVGGGGTTVLPVCAVIFNDKLFVLRVSTDSKILFNVSDGQNWAGWREIGGTTAYPVTAAAMGNRLSVFSIGVGYQTFSNFTEDGQNWDGWRLVPGQPSSDLPVAATTSGGNLFLCTAWPILEYTRLLGYPRVYPFGDYALGNNPRRFYRMLANISPDGENWSGAREISGMGRTRLPLGVTDFGGQPFVFAVGADQKTYFAVRRDG